MILRDWGFLKLSLTLRTSNRRKYVWRYFKYFLSSLQSLVRFCHGRVVFFAIMSGTLNMDITWLQLIIQMALTFSRLISGKKNRWHWNLTMLPHVTEIVLFPVYLNLIVWSHFPVLFTNRNFDKNRVVKFSLILWRFVSSQQHWNSFPLNSLPFDCHSAWTELSSSENYT